jgi:hypothetical protein
VEVQYANDRLRCSTYFFAIFSSLAAQADPLAYATTGDNQFGVVDLNTGVFTVKGQMGVRLTGLGEVGGNLYGGGYASGTLYSVNHSTGALTTIGSGSLTYWATGSTKRGLFALDNSAKMNLYSINPNTGGATLVGLTGLSPTAIVEGMSTGSALGLFPLSLGIGGQAVDFFARKRTDQVLPCNNSGSLAILAAILLASSLLSNLAAERRPALPRNKCKQALSAVIDPLRGFSLP